METLRPERTRRMRWLPLVMVPLLALVVTVHVPGLATVAAVLTPLAGIVIAVLGVWALKARGRRQAGGGAKGMDSQRAQGAGSATGWSGGTPGSSLRAAPRACSWRA